MPKNEKQIATYVDDNTYQFFLDRIVPKYGVGAAGALRWLVAQERLRIENNNTKEHALEVLQAEMVELQEIVRRLKAQNELGLYALMGILVRIKAEPVTVDGNTNLEIKLGEDIVRQMRELVDSLASNG